MIEREFGGCSEINRIYQQSVKIRPIRQIRILFGILPTGD